MGLTLKPAMSRANASSGLSFELPALKALIAHLESVPHKAGSQLTPLKTTSLPRQQQLDYNCMPGIGNEN